MKYGDDSCFFDGSFTVTNLNFKPMVAALRQIADQLESGQLVYKEGGIVIRTNQLPPEEGGFRQLKVESDLVFTDGGAPNDQSH